MTSDGRGRPSHHDAVLHGPTPLADDAAAAAARAPGPRPIGRWIAAGLLLGIVCGVLFGDYCRGLELVGRAYVGLLQMTVLPYLTLSLTAKLGRLDVRQARRLGLTVLVVLLLLWVIGIVLIMCVSWIFPPIEGASFFGSAPSRVGVSEQDLLSQFIPANVFRSLADEYVPAVVVFCLFLGGALMFVPGKEPLLDFLDLCSAAIGQVNLLLIRLAPIGLFLLSAAAAGTMRLEELSRLQAYLIAFTLACVVAAFGVLPLLLSSLTSIGYRDLFRAAQEPLLTVIGVGKLFVVLPQIADKCEQLLGQQDESASRLADPTPSVVVPLAYPFPHLGKILPFVFISFGAWYVGHGLNADQTAAMAGTGVVSSFASPLVSMPYLLDQYHLPQDLMALFILPGFVTTRLADVVGVMHLMALTLIVAQAMKKRLRIRWGRLVVATLAMLVCLGMGGGACRWYLASTTLKYDLDQRLLALEIPSPCDDVVVYQTRDGVPSRAPLEGATLDRVKQRKVLRVGYHPDHLPYSYFNQQRQLVGLDVELMHRLASRLQVRLEFVPYTYDTVIRQLESGQIDVAVGGLVMNPERLLRVGFTQPYQTASAAILLPDYRRGEFVNWDDPHRPASFRLGATTEDVAVVARRHLPNVEIVVIDSFRSFFVRSHHDLDGLLIAAEEGAAWSILHPEYTVVVPEPVLRRPVSMAVRSADAQWIRFLDRWLDFERLDGTLDQLRVYWIEGGGTKKQTPRWCVLRDVLHWLP